ncbi:Sin-like protein conserved region-domain-containing protein [Achaetomium macrosporum]|uniref:Sin-like protein conserved region-domain-containing protein n=1 Tax=Achaetomium macrosporum TaxID=79813 RepID=A0AAN7HAU9_9PEZI|nr:Sin-like protein conserved region-domain-containing protein [Achaetomium macrosporum]
MPSANRPPVSPTDEDDPVVASYSVFIKPPLPEHRKLVVFEHVTKTSQDPAQIRVPRIAELRVKPSTGMYEVDVPIDTAEAYDRNKGIAWGIALQKSMEAKKGGSLGLAGGFNIVPTATTAGRGRRGGGGTDDDDLPLGWAEAARQDKVLRTQTFGGARSAQEANTRHMIGVFQGKNLHLTPVSSVVHLRPVPHHLDAATEQDRLSRGGSGSAASGGPTDKAAGSAGRAIHMTIKSAMDAEGGVATETIADRLRNVQTETWQRMEWVHDEAEMAWEAYNECLLLRTGSSNNNNKTQGGGEEVDGQDGADGDGSKDKGKEPEAGPSNDDSSAAHLVDKVARLRTEWAEQELLQAMSGTEGHKADQKGTGNGKEAAEKTEEEMEARQPGRAGRSSAAASATRRGKGKAANTAGAMEID